MAVKPTRRTQPYRRGLATKMAGAAGAAMQRGAPAGLQNPMDVKRTLAKRMKNIQIPNPLGAIDKVWKDAQGPTDWPKSPAPRQEPPIVLAGTKRPKRRRARTGSRSDSQ